EAVKRQNRHLGNLVRKGVLAKDKRAEVREALDMWNARNLDKATIEAATKGKPIEREKQKIAALIDLLEKHRVTPPEGKTWGYYRKAYATTTMSAKELARDRDLLWRWSGVADIVTWYRDKAGGND